MVTNRNFQNPIHQEENTPLVTIMETKLATKQSTAQDARGVKYVIDLTKASFGGIVYPIPGTQWILKRISNVWTLMARAPQQNPQLGTTFTPVVGQTYIGNEGDTHIVGNLVVNGTVTSSGSGTPDSDIGVIRAWTTSTPPTGNLLCDGSAVSRTTYSLLFGVIGTTYGVGDGSTTFNLPNLKGRAIVGFDGSQTEFNTLGMTGGEKAHTLSSAELPGHTHSFSATSGGVSVDHTHPGSTLSTSDPGNFHTHTIGTDHDTASGSFGFSVHQGAGGGASTSNASSAAGSHTHTISGSTGGMNTDHSHNISGTTGSTGSGTAHNNLQPYIVLYFIIKALSTGSGGGGGGGGGGGSSTLAGLTDVTITSAHAADHLEYNGTKWVNVQSLSMGATSTAGTYFQGGLYTDAGSRITLYADGKLAWGDGTNPADLNLYRSSAGVLKTDNSILLNDGQVVNIGGSLSGASFKTKRANSTDYSFSSRYGSDTNSRLAWRSDGQLEWSDGTNTQDTFLYRASAALLQTNGAFGTSNSSSSNITLASYVNPDAFDRFHLLADGTMQWGSGAATRDTNLYRIAAGATAASGATLPSGPYLSSDGSVVINAVDKQFNAGGSGSAASFAALRSANTGSVFSSRIAGDVNGRYVVLPDGTIRWGDGVVSVDTNLYRNAAGVLKTDYSLIVGANFTIGSVQIDPSSPVTGNVLQYNGTKFVPANPAAAGAVGCRVYLSAAQSIGNNSWTSINWNNKEFDTTGTSMWASSPNPGRITVPQDGYYVVHASIGFAFNATGCRGIRFEKNGTPIQGGHIIVPTTTTNSNLAEPSASVIIKCVAGDFISVDALQDSGGSLSTYTASSNFYPTFSVMLINTSLANLDSLSDVVITAATTNDVLQYNGTNWVNGQNVNLTGTAQVNVGASGSTAAFAANLATATGDYGLSTMANGDTSRRFRLRTDGYQDWGPGNAAADTNFYRGGVGRLQSDNVYMANIGLAGNDGIMTRVAAEAGNRFSIHGDGQHIWNDGTSPGLWDVNLYRSSAATLTVGGNFAVASNLTAGTTTWTSYTPTWGSDGTAPSIGNGTITGQYMVLGSMVIAQIKLNFGSTTTYGTGNYNVSLPIAVAAGNSAQGALSIWAQAAGTRRGGVIHGDPGGTTAYLMHSTGSITGTSPITFTTNYAIECTITYRK